MCFCARVLFLLCFAAFGCEARAWENEMRLYARGMNASFDRIDSRGKDVETTLREFRRFVFKARTEEFLSPKNFGSLLRERRDVFRVDFSTDQTLSSFFTKRGTHTQVGLDAAGKTTILYKLKLGEIVTTIPTIGTFSIFLLRVFTTGSFPLIFLSFLLPRNRDRPCERETAKSSRPLVFSPLFRL